MKIFFKNKKLEKQLSDLKTMKKFFGVMAKKTFQRMEELSSVENLEDLYLIPQANCHQLSGDRNEQFAVSISRNYRIIFTPYGKDLPRNPDGSIKKIEITSIEIIDNKIDYHNK
jgi:plasmid maintenance system killer protein